MSLAPVLHMAMRRVARQPTGRQSWEKLRDAFARAEAATHVRAKVLAFPTPPKPLPTLASAPPFLSNRRTFEQEELLLQEINGCKALLLEIVRRAAYDWVLYRSSTRLIQKSLAEAAFHWLFMEAPDTQEWKERTKEGKTVTSSSASASSLASTLASCAGTSRA